MSRTKSSCPTEAELRGFHAQEFAPDVHGTISAHLASCNQCEARAAALRREHDSWLQQLRAAGPPPDSPHVMVPAPLPEIDGYEIRSELRRGGQGIVYRALQQSTRREVAIKVLREGPFAGSAARRRFDREVELAASLQHPGIVQVFDSGVMRDGRQYLVMDCIRGVDLEAYRAAHSLDLEQTLALFAQICDAVHFAHQRGVIHRDLKPSNVLVDESGRAYVLDFGLASLVRNDAETRHTLTGHVAGTLAYLSPEQARGLPDAIDVRSDVYALGVILFELLTGKQPYRTQGDTLVALTTIAEVVPPPLAAVPPRFSLQENRRAPGDLETIVRTALAKDRARRYQSAAELSRDVMHYLKAEPIDARRDSALDLLRSALRRHQTLFAAALAFTTLAVMSAVAMGYLYLEQTRQRAIADEQRQLARNAAQIAEDRFEKVRELAKAFIHELDPLIKHVPGTAPARAFIVRTGLQYLTELQRDAENDPRLWPDLAAAYVAIGDVQGDKVSSNLNDAAAALESYRKAEKIARTLLAEGSSSSQINNTLCITLQKIGDIQESQRQFDEALKNYQEALGVAQQMSRDQPSTNMLRTVATAHERIGNVLVRLGKLDDALVEYRKANALSAECLAQQADDDGFQRDVAVGHTKIARFLYQKGDLSGTLAEYRAFMDIVQRLHDREPANMVYRHDVGVGNQWHCILLTELGRPEEALNYCRNALNMSQDLFAADEKNELLFDSMLQNLTKYGEALLAAGRRAEANAIFEKLLAGAGAYAAIATDQVESQRLLGVANYKLYELHKSMAADEARSTEERRASWEEAIRRLVECHGIFVAGRERGILAQRDADVPEQLQEEVDQTRATFEKWLHPYLTSESTNSSDAQSQEKTGQ